MHSTYHMWAPNLTRPWAVTPLALGKSRPANAQQNVCGPASCTPVHCNSHTHTRTVTSADRASLHFLPIRCRPNPLPIHVAGALFLATLHLCSVRIHAVAPFPIAAALSSPSLHPHHYHSDPSTQPRLSVSAGHIPNFVISALYLIDTKVCSVDLIIVIWM
jgi:hypothetical protein